MSDIEVKGGRNGLVLLLPPNGSNEEIATSFEAYLAAQGDFFKGASIMLDVGDRVLSGDDLIRLQAISRARKVSVVSLRAADAATRQAAEKLELATITPREAGDNGAERSSRPIAVPKESRDALILRRTMRNGQVVRSPDSVVVIGDVNAGAEIVAGGDVVVWGSLRGVVHAGAMGDDNAIVCALDLSPTQLRISSQIAMSPETTEKSGRSRLRPWKRTEQQSPEQARLQDEEIIVERWAAR